MKHDWVLVAALSVLARDAFADAPRGGAIDGAAACAAVDVTAEVWSILLPSARGPEPTVDVLAGRLARLGEAGVVPIVSVLLGEAEEPDVAHDVHPRAIDLRLAVLESALRRLPRGPVLDALTARAGAPSDADRRILIVSTLASIGGRDALERALAVAGGLDPIQYERAFVRAPLEHALVRFAGDERSAITALGRALDLARGGWAAALARAVGDARRPEAGAILVRNLGRDPRLDVELVRGLGRCAAFSPSVYDTRTLERLRQGLLARDAELVHATMEALAEVGDADAAPALVAALEDADATTVFVARRALETLAGGAHGTDAASWSAYVEAEFEWRASRFPALCEMLADDDIQHVAAVAGELLQHRLLRVRIASVLRPRLAAVEPESRALVARLAGQLGARNAVPWLADLAQDVEPAVRDAAVASLATLTGLDPTSPAETWAALAPSVSERTRVDVER